MAGKSQAKVPLVSSMSSVNLVEPTSNSPRYISSTVAFFRKALKLSNPDVSCRYNGPKLWQASSWEL